MVVGRVHEDGDSGEVVGVGSRKNLLVVIQVLGHGDEMILREGETRTGILSASEVKTGGSRYEKQYTNLDIGEVESLISRKKGERRWSVASRGFLEVVSRSVRLRVRTMSLLGATLQFSLHLVVKERRERDESQQCWAE